VPERLLGSQGLRSIDVLEQVGGLKIFPKLFGHVIRLKYCNILSFTCKITMAYVMSNVLLMIVNFSSLVRSHSDLLIFV
jgi:hypothetical protein